VRAAIKVATDADKDSESGVVDKGVGSLQWLFGVDGGFPEYGGCK
jgi:hypothetical protein